MFAARMIVVAALAGAFCAQGAAARNLVTNFDHREKMGVDLPTGWVKHIRHKLVTTLDALPQPDDPEAIAASLGWKDANRMRNGQ